jgi:site-specific recombinase XerD
VRYNHKYASLREFAEHLSLVGKRLRTAQCYYRQMRLVSEHFGGNPKPLAQKAIRSYILHLKQERGWAPSTLRQAIASCRLFYAGMLGKDWKLWDVVSVRDDGKLPVVLGVEGVRSVLGSVALMRHRTPLRLIYCCGLRLDEAVKLTVDDVEPGRVLVRDGKGGKDRYVPLGATMLGELRRYWLQHRNPKWLFPSAGRGRPSNARERMGKSDAPFGKGALQLAFHAAVVASGIRKKATIHTLRHSYATHLLAMGVNIRQLQLYLGHESIETTCIYLHLIPFGEERSMEHVEAIAKMTL